MPRTTKRNGVMRMITKHNKVGVVVGLVVFSLFLLFFFYPPKPTAVKATNRAVKTTINVVAEQKKEIEQHKIETKTKAVKIREYVEKDVEKLPPDALVAAVLAELGDFRRAAPNNAP